MRDKKTSEVENSNTTNPFNHLIVSQFDEQKKKQFIDKFLNGVDI